MPQEKLQEIKAHLIDNGIHYNDGYEDVSFSGRYFNDMPIVYRQGNKQVISRASHSLRVISASTFRLKMAEVIDTNKKPNSFFNLEKSLTNNQYFLADNSVSVFRLSAIHSLEELLDVLKRGR